MNNLTILTAPVVELKKLENLYIELTNQNCNLKCKHCYISFDFKKVKDYIPFDTIKKALKDLKDSDVKNICLTGGEPLLHPDFNAILRTCLKHKPTIIFSNGMNINDKKARFLKKVEDEGENPIGFFISVDSYDERKNDDIRGRGSFRKALGAISSLTKYNFTPTIKYTNYYLDDVNVIRAEFEHVFDRFEICPDDVVIDIQPYFNKQINVDMPDVSSNLVQKLSCNNSRILTAKGIYNCPMLANDYRARTGSDFTSFSTKAYLETEICSQCVDWAFSN